MKEAGFKVYGYRWVVLLAFMAVVAMNQLAWLSFASITSDAAEYYGVSDLAIGLLSMSFMIVYIIFCIPASWAIDTWGIRVGVGIGAVLTGAFALMRGLVAESYALVLVAQIGIAMGQPFVNNAVTKVAARWFPLGERATASGLGTLAMYVGMAGGLVLTPILFDQFEIPGMLLVYGIAAITAAVVFFVAVREHPPTPPCPPDREERALVLDGLKQTLRKRDFVLLMLVFFIGLGMFNAVTTWIEDVVGPRGFTSNQAGLTGGLMIVGGVIGALIVPILSDRVRRRVPFIIVAIAGATLGLLGVTFAESYWLLLASAFVMGFGLLSAGPVGFQYGAEVAYPAPEGTSNGLLLLMGQISGIAFIFAMDGLKNPDTGSMTVPLIGLIVLMALGLFLCTRLRESALIRGTSSG
jgi:MFS family permease